jgi:hypothetical protein
VTQLLANGQGAAADAPSGPVTSEAVAPDWHLEAVPVRAPVWSDDTLPASNAWQEVESAPEEVAPAALRPTPPRVAAGHNLMLLAAFSRMELPPEIAALFAPAPLAPSAAPFQPTVAMASGAHDDRWSADGWLLLRKDTTSAVTSGRGSYGQSQMGAVVRYRLAPSSPFRPTAYARASQALGGAKESEAALGLAARPVPGLPVSAAAELRVTQVSGSTQVRPAAYVVTELPRFDLPLGFAGEAYAQAGYVGGGFATAFVDGQLRAERPVASLGSGELRAGGGAWGGAQKGAKRLDIGPSATLAIEIGGTPPSVSRARVSMDWRFRVAGEAEPSSGPALTISAGF